MPKEVDPKDTTRAAAYALWMKAPNPMVTFYYSLTKRTLRATIISKHTRFSTYLRTYLFISNL